jgi:hypothetical protein
VTPAVGLHGVWVNGRRIANERSLLDSEVRPGRCCAILLPDPAAT